MTREKLVEILNGELWGNIDSVIGKGAAADGILSALEVERVGEVVLGTDVEPYSYCYKINIPTIPITSDELRSVISKKGSLIFRPMEGEK